MVMGLIPEEMVATGMLIFHGGAATMIQSRLQPQSNVAHVAAVILMSQFQSLRS